MEGDNVKRAKLRKRKHKKVSSAAVRPSTTSDFVTIPALFEGMSREEIRVYFEKMASSANDAYETSSVELHDIFSRGDPVQIIADFSYYFFHYQADPHNVQNGERVHLHHLELLQAIALRTRLEDCRREGRVADSVQRAIELIKINTQAFAGKRILANSDSEPARRTAVIEQIRNDTQFVRAPFTAQQTERYLRAIFESLDDSFFACHGIKASDLLTLLMSLMRHIERQLNTYGRLSSRVLSCRKGKALEAYFDAFPEEEDRRDEIVTDAAFKQVAPDLMHLYLWEESNRFLPRCYSFTSADIAAATPVGSDVGAAERAIAQWSLGFGDLADHAFDHLYLANPVWDRPFIQMEDGSFFWPSPATFLAFAFEMFERLIGTDPNLVQRYERTRADILEDELGKLLHQYFPTGQVLSGIRWVDPEDGRAYENDKVVLIDRAALLFEAKSGQVTQEARRGADRRLQREIRKLMVEPAHQSARLHDLLARERGVHSFAIGESKATIDSSTIDTFIRVNVTFNNIGSLSSRWPQLVEAGFIPVDVAQIPTMSLSDLEIVFELLEHEAVICHYLRRRTQFERNAVYIADEYDLVAFYLKTGFNIGETEFDGTLLGIYGMSEELDPYFSRRVGRKPCARPVPKQTKLWKHIHKHLERRKPENWLEIAYRLLNVGYKEQRLVEQKLNATRNKIKRSTRRCDSIAAEIASGPPQRREGVVIAVYKCDDREERDALLRARAVSLMGSAGIQDCLVLGIDAQLPHAPYHVVGIAHRHPDSSDSDSPTM